MLDIREQSERFELRIDGQSYSYLRAAQETHTHFKHETDSNPGEVPDPYREEPQPGYDRLSSIPISP